MQKEDLTSLKDILENQKDNFQSLLKIAEKKRDEIIENNVERLKELVEEENEIVSDLEELESERIELVKLLQGKLDIQEEKISYSELIENLPDGWKDKLQPVREGLLSIIEKVHIQNQENKVLIQEALRLNNFSINMFTKMVDVDIYTKEGTAENTGSRHIIDRRG